MRAGVSLAAAAVQCLVTMALLHADQDTRRVQVEVEDGSELNSVPPGVFDLNIFDIFWNIFGTKFANVAGTRPTHTPRADKANSAVFINGFPRSATSTILSMVKATTSSTGDLPQRRMFTLFEPCHPGDVVDGHETVNHEVSTRGLRAGQRLASDGCVDLLDRLVSCRFNGVDHLWGWTNLHTTNHNEAYDPELAAKYCSAASIVVVKSIGAARWVDSNRYISQLQPLLTRNPNLKILDVVRDPRSIYASWKTTEPFPQILADRSVPLHDEICDTFARNSKVFDSRVHRVVFEDLVSHPNKVIKDVYAFLGLPFQAPQMDFVKRTFNSEDCNGISENNYTDCHADSRQQKRKWRRALSQAEVDMFRNNTDCQLVFNTYGYPPS